MAQEQEPRPRKAGLPPGTLVHVGKKTSNKVTIDLIQYDAETFSEGEFHSVNELKEAYKGDHIAWININGLHQTDLISEIGVMFGIDSLTLEDLLDTLHRPVVEVFEDHIFLTMKMMGLGPHKKVVLSEQVSFVLGDNWVLSFQEQKGDLFDSFRASIGAKRGLVRSRKADYLFYRLIDILVDNYFVVSDHFEEKSEKLEEEIWLNQDPSSLQAIQRKKKELIVFRKAVRPLREAISEIISSDTSLIDQSNDKYFRDVYEHVIQMGEAIEAHRDALASIRDLYMTGISNRMNQIMQVLTIVSTIFIPLTFIAGIYGMNFDNMPELHWKYAYPAIWIVMIAIFVLMLRFFRRKSWL